MQWRNSVLEQAWEGQRKDDGELEDVGASLSQSERPGQAQATFFFFTKYFKHHLSIVKNNTVKSLS